MLPVPSGVKVWLAAGHCDADRAAFMATLIMTAKLNDIAPQAWLADVLARIADTPAIRLEQLLPWNQRHQPSTLKLPDLWPSPEAYDRRRIAKRSTPP